MRTYSGFLLFENLLDSIPQINSSLYGFGKMTLSPRVTIVDDDCGTTVGTIVDLNYDREGELELATELTLTKTRIDSILSSGKYQIAVRTAHSCVSAGGVCQKCYAGTYIDAPIPPVGTVIEMPPSYNFQTDVLRGTGALLYFSLSQSPDTYEKALVIKDGVILTSGYTISGSGITLSAPLALNSNIVVKYYKTSTQPYMGYMANTYSGSLLGIKYLPTDSLILRSGLFQSLILEPQLVSMEKELKVFTLIPDSLLSYSSQIKNRLERALYILCLYSLFSNAA